MNLMHLATEKVQKEERTQNLRIRLLYKKKQKKHESAHLHLLIKTHDLPEAILLVNGTPDPIGGVSEIARVTLWVETQVNVAQLGGTARGGVRLTETLFCIIVFLP